MAANITKKTNLKEEILPKNLNLSQTTSLDLISSLQEIRGTDEHPKGYRRDTISETQAGK